MDWANTMALLLTLTWLTTFISSVDATTPTLTNTSITYSSNETNTILDINITFQLTSTISHGDQILINLPHFSTSTPPNSQTSGSHISLGDLHLSPSITWLGEWTEGTYCSLSSCDVPYATSRLTLELRSLEAPPSINSHHTIQIFASNNIHAHCGHGANDTTLVLIAGLPFDSSSSIGRGCHNNCNTNNDHHSGGSGGGGGGGTCDHCRERCICHESHSSRLSPADCSLRTCPLGYPLATRPSSTTVAHISIDDDDGRVECSHAGSCHRSTGTCHCYPGWEGAACDRRSCPEDCSGHGSCVGQRRLAARGDAVPLSSSSYEYGGTVAARAGVAWDAEVMYGCVCDSEWVVGLGAGEVQSSQWFGADCSLKRCPGGDDPATVGVDETNCEGVVAEGGRGTGGSGNLCHVECSNRGVCVYESGGIGRCRCFDGFVGDNCGVMSEFGGADGVWTDVNWVD